MKQLTYLWLICMTIILANCQIGRDVYYQFLKLDTDNDYLLSKDELDSKLQDVKNKRNFYTHEDYKKVVYPRTFWKQFDVDGNKKISTSQLSKIIDARWKKYVKQWPTETNILQILDQNQYLRVCDMNKDQQLEVQEFPACSYAVLTLQQDSYPWKIKSLLYSNQNIGYDLDEFKKLMMKSKNAAGPAYEEHLKQLFTLFEWDGAKIDKDTDDLIGSEQGKFMEAAFVMIHLDRNADGELNKDEALFFLDKYGGSQVFEIIDMDENNKLDRNQFISYYAFASCIKCDKSIQPQSDETSKHESQKNNQQKDHQETNEDL